PTFLLVIVATTTRSSKWRQRTTYQGEIAAIQRRARNSELLQQQVVVAVRFRLQIEQSGHIVQRIVEHTACDLQFLGQLLARNQGVGIQRCKFGGIDIGYV